MHMQWFSELPTCQSWGVCCYVYVIGAKYRTPVGYQNISTHITSVYTIKSTKMMVMGEMYN